MTIKSETVSDWGRWFRTKGISPILARRWTDADEETSSGAVRADDGSVWAWSRECGRVEVWRADGDEWWDTDGAVEPGMAEAQGGDACLRLLSKEDPWDARSAIDAADERRDRMMRDIFG